MRRRIDLAIAVAQERLLNTHVEHLLELITLVGDHVPFENVLGIYTRLLHLTEDEARVITTRTLATLGERTGDQNPWVGRPRPERAQEEAQRPQNATLRPREGAAPLSFMRQFRQRLRGRVNDELRKWVELSAARTEVALLETHVENALNFVDLLGKELPFNEAVELYLDALEVREGVAEVVYFITLSRLAERHLPDGGGGRAGAPARRDEAVVVAAATEERHLRVVDNEGA